MMKKYANVIILSLSLLLAPVAYGSTDVTEIKKELKEVKEKLRSAKGSTKSRLMKRMARLENKLTESSSADRKRSK